MQDLSPGGQWRLVCREDDRATAHVSLVDDVEQHVDGVRAVGQVANFGDDQDVPLQVSFERLASLAGAGSNVNGAVDGEAAVLPFDNVRGQPPVQDIALEEEGVDPLAEAGTHLGEADLWDVEEAAVAVEATLEHETVPWRVPSPRRVAALPRKRAGTLKHDDRNGAEERAGRSDAEVPYQPLDEAADLPAKALVVPKKDAKDLGKGENELTVRQSQQQLLVHVLAQQEGPLLGAGGTQVEDAAAEGAGVFRPGISGQGLGVHGDGMIEQGAGGEECAGDGSHRTAQCPQAYA